MPESRITVAAEGVAGREPADSSTSPAELLERFVGYLREKRAVSARTGDAYESDALTFADRTARDRWLASPKRHAVLTAMSELTDGQPTLNVVGDCAGWFGGGSQRAPRRWKQAIVVIAG
jgi:antibiotic biosynthesis monooxygenase (ABM) superfamily enzyme